MCNTYSSSPFSIFFWITNKFWDANLFTFYDTILPTTSTRNSRHSLRLFCNQMRLKEFVFPHKYDLTQNTPSEHILVWKIWVVQGHTHVHHICMITLRNMIIKRIVVIGRLIHAYVTLRAPRPKTKPGLEVRTRHFKITDNLFIDVRTLKPTYKYNKI